MERTNTNTEEESSTTTEQPEPAAPAATTHPNVRKMEEAFFLIADAPEFYTSDSRVNKFLEVCKLPDPTLKLWRASLTNARKELNDKAMEEARSNTLPVAIPTDQAITDLACEKFKASWRKVGKGKPLPDLPLQD